MSKRTTDELWKAVLEAYFEQAILFFRPTFYQKIDWTRPPEFLDKELDALFPESDSIRRAADKLAKVWLKTGEEVWVLIHIEVQGYFDKDFEKRMFIYFVRIRERYEKAIYALAVLTDHHPDWRPTEYVEAFENTRVVYQFDSYKVLDHPPETLENSENPFSIAIETAYEVAKTYGLNDETKHRAGLNLVRRMMSRGFSKDDIGRFLIFIRQYFRFKKTEAKRTFDHQINQFIQYIPTMTLEEIYKEALLEELKEEAYEEGMEKGMEKEKLNSIRKMLSSGMEAKLVANILDVDLEKVKTVETELRENGELKD